jgi:hypothetical protein
MVLLTTAAVVDVCAEGTIWFANYVCENMAAVYDYNELDKLSGTNFLAQLYVGAAGSREEDLKAVGYPPVPFSGALLLRGYFNGGVYTLAGFPPHTNVLAQVRAWTAISGATYEEAVQTGLKTMAFDHRFGKSNLIPVRLGDGEYETPPYLIGLMAFGIYPPPYTLEATRATNHLVLSWPAVDTNYVLEASQTVPSTNWVLVPQVPSVQGDKRVVTEEISGTQKFYRLRRL